MVAVDRKENRSELKRAGSSSLGAVRAKSVLLLVDLLAASLGIIAAAAIRPSNGDELLVSGIILAAWALWLGRGRLYSARFITRRSDELRRIIDAGVATAATVGVVSFTLKLEPGRVWLALAVLFGSVLIVLERELVRRRFARARRAGRMTRRVLMVGANAESEALQAMFRDEPELGYRVVEVLDPRLLAKGGDLTTRVLASARSNEATGAIICATAVDTQPTNRLIRDLLEAGIHVELSSTLADIEPKRLTVRPLGRYPVVYVEPVIRHGWRSFAKRSFDLTLSGTGLFVIAPLLLVIAAGVKRSSPGPVLFRQSRVGRNGVPFDVVKFRTMVLDAEDQLKELEEDNEGAGPLFKMKDDPRVTRLGAFLRKTSVDELPQLWNVVRGEMSLVGPRPALASEMAGWDSELYGRLRVKPGITGMWQVSGRSETTFEEYTRLDLYYVDNWSLIVDLTILAKTVPAVLGNDGAY